MAPHRAFLLLAAAFSTTEAAADAGAPTVSVPGLGQMVGALTEIPSVAAFKGIPYAEPPTGKLRWQPPVAKAAWAPTTLNATAFGDACVSLNTEHIMISPAQLTFSRRFPDR